MYFSLTLKHGTLEPVQAGVPADFVVVVAAAHPVLAEHAGAFGDLIGVGGHHAGVAGGAEVLGGIEAEGGDIAEGAGGFGRSTSAPQAWAASSMSLSLRLVPMSENASQSTGWP